MSVKYWLFSCCLTNEEVELVEQHYLDACRDIKIPKSLKSWFNSDGVSILDVSDCNHSGLHKFTWDFNIESLNNLTKTVLACNDFELDESNIVDFIMIDDMPPIALLAYGLGSYKFRELPGTVGGSLMKGFELRDRPFTKFFNNTEKKTVYMRIDSFLKSAYSFCDSPPDQEVIDKIVNFYVDAEAEAISRGCNLLTLSSRSL